MRRAHRFLDEQGITAFGNACAGNSVNCAAFRAAPLLLRDEADVTGYYDPDGHFFTALIDRKGVRRVVIENDRPPFDAYQAISPGCDVSRRIRVTFGADDSPLRMCHARGHELAPIISRAVWIKERRLVAFVQRCQQRVGSDGLHTHAVALARLRSWRPTPAREAIDSGFRAPHARSLCTATSPEQA